MFPLIEFLSLALLTLPVFAFFSRRQIAIFSASSSMLSGCSAVQLDIF